MFLQISNEIAFVTVICRFSGTTLLGWFLFFFTFWCQWAVPKIALHLASPVSLVVALALYERLKVFVNLWQATMELRAHVSKEMIIGRTSLGISAKPLWNRLQTFPMKSHQLSCATSGIDVADPDPKVNPNPNPNPNSTLSLIVKGLPFPKSLTGGLDSGGVNNSASQCKCKKYCKKLQLFV